MMFQTLGYYICMPFAALVRFFYTLTGSYGLVWCGTATAENLAAAAAGTGTTV